MKDLVANYSKESDGSPAKLTGKQVDAKMKNNLEDQLRLLNNRKKAANSPDKKLSRRRSSVMASKSS